MLHAAGLCATARLSLGSACISLLRCCQSLTAAACAALSVAAAPFVCLQDPHLLQDAVDTGNAPRLALLLQHPQLDTSNARLYKAVGAVPGDQLGRLAAAGYSVNVQREEGCLLVHRAVQASFWAGRAGHQLRANLMTSVGAAC